MNPHTGQMSRDKARRLCSLGAAVAVAVLLATGPVLAQGWWPWSDSEPERPPVPEEPVYQDPYQEPPPPSAPPTADWSTKNPICLQLEQRLVQESQRTPRNTLPQLEAEIDQTDQSLDAAKRELERRDCYEYFLFSKTLRRTRACVDLSRQAEQAKRHLSELETRRQQIIGSSERSYRGEIVRELARNNCGANYTQEARRQDRGGGIFSSIWQDEEGESYSNNWTPYGAPLSSATYRTVCVRLCDGYYFPVSFSTLPSHFEQDQNVCQSKCAAPVELYYYQNPGATVDQSVALRTQEPYTTLKTAFRYRKELVPGCSCKQAEYAPLSTPQGTPQQAPAGAQPMTDKRAEGDGSGWAARSEWDARSR